MKETVPIDQSQGVYQELVYRHEVLGSFSNDYGDGKSNRFIKQNNNFARESRFFVHFFAVGWTTTAWKCLLSRFMEDANKPRRIFLSLSNF